MLYKGYIKTKGKKAIEAFKDRTKYRTYDEVKNLEGFGGVLADDTILIDIDDAEQSEILMNIVEEYQLDCRVYCTSRGRHFLFKNHSITRNRTHVPLAVGLTADIKLGTRSSYEVIKIDGEERFIEWDIEEGGAYQEVPKWLFPVRTAVDFLDMDAGDGRNQALFNYILTLTSNDFRPLLEDGRFVQPHRSYVVNLRCAELLAPGELRMHSGARIPVPRGREAAVRDAMERL